MRGACCDAAIACRGHSECAAIDACVQSSTEAGFSDCRQEHEGAFRGEYAALSSCRARSCASECGVECGGFTYWRAECAKCGNSECCTAATACGESAGCLALLYCKQNCSSIDTACHLDCERAHSSGVMSALRFTECLLQKCPGECGYLAPDLSCSHHSVWPAPIHGLGVEVEARVIVLTGGTRPHPGAIVRLCEPGDVACLQPMAEGTTDELGIVRLGVQHGSKGYLWLEGEAPTIHYLRPRPAAGGPSKRERTTYLGAAGYAVADFRAVMAHKVPVLEQKGHVFYEVLDCRGFFMPGVSVELDPHDGGGGRVLRPDRRARCDRDRLSGERRFPQRLTRQAHARGHAQGNRRVRGPTRDRRASWNRDPGDPVRWGLPAAGREAAKPARELRQPVPRTAHLSR